MPRPQYWPILQEVAEILRANLPGYTVAIEEELQLGLEMTPRIGVYLDSRQYPPDQPIAAGRVSRIILNLSIWVFCGSLELQSAISARDNAIAEIEEVLSANRTLNDKVDTLWLEGGELPSARDPSSNGFMSGGEIVCHVEITVR